MVKEQDDSSCECSSVYRYEGCMFLDTQVLIIIIRTILLMDGS